MRYAIAMLTAVTMTVAGGEGQKAEAPRGFMLGDLSWVEAERVLTPDAVVVLPLGMAAVERGPHLKLNNNERLANYLAARVRAAADVVIAPTLTYHFSPTFTQYPGSTSLSLETARDMTVEMSAAWPASDRAASTSSTPA